MGLLVVLAFVYKVRGGKAELQELDDLCDFQLTPRVERGVVEELIPYDIEGFVYWYTGE